MLLIADCCCCRGLGLPQVLIRCAPSAYQTALSDLVLRKREEKAAARSSRGGGGDSDPLGLGLGGCGGSGGGGGASIQNLLMEQRSIANHPFLSKLHDGSLEAALPAHPAHAPVRLSGKLEALDRILPKLKAGGHRVLVFCTMTRMMDVLGEYLQARSPAHLSCCSNRQPSSCPSSELSLRSPLPCALCAWLGFLAPWIEPVPRLS